VNFVTEDAVDVHDVADGSFFLVSFLHEFCCFPSDQTQTDDVCFHCAIQFDGIFGIQQKTFGDDASIINEKVNSSADVFDPFESSSDLILITYVAFYALEVVFLAQRLSHCLLKRFIRVRNYFDALALRYSPPSYPYASTYHTQSSQTQQELCTEQHRCQLEQEKCATLKKTAKTLRNIHGKTSPEIYSPPISHKPFITFFVLPSCHGDSVLAHIVIQQQFNFNRRGIPEAPVTTATFPSHFSIAICVLRIRIR
jgi:hypothetical protein